MEQIGSPTEIYHRPATEFVAGFIGEANLLPASVVSRDGGEVVIEVAGQRIVTQAADATDDDSSVFMVRPERVTVATTPAEGHASISATVSELIFRGANTRVEMETSAGDRFVAHIVDGVDIDSLRPGSTAFANWEPSAGYLVPSTTEPSTV